jgi:protocatechuate 3,4-dioxygenase beta subunit
MMKFINRFFALTLLLACVSLGAAQESSLINASLKGKVRDENGKTLAGVSVTLRQGEKEVKVVATDKNGEFLFENLKPGVYGLTCRKAGLRTTSAEDITLRAGDKFQLKDKIVMDVNEGELALIRVSVFTAEGRSAAGVKVELMRVNADGSMKKIDDTYTGTYGQAAFRRTPDTAQYRVIAKIGNNPASEVVNVEGAAIYRTAIQLPPK